MKTLLVTLLVIVIALCSVSWLGRHTLWFTFPVSVVTSSKYFMLQYPNGDFLKCYSANIDKEKFKAFVMGWAVEDCKNEIPYDVEPNCPDVWLAFKSSKAIYRSPDTNDKGGSYAIMHKGRLWFLAHRN